MQLADRGAIGVSDVMAAPPSVAATVSGWGGGPRVQVAVSRIASTDALSAAIRNPRLVGLIARGMGRSYGDAAQVARGLVLETTGLHNFELDAERGLVRAEAGVTLGTLLAALEPAGWTLPVVPGTQHVTVGGAIAADIHGKNHGVAGTFGTHVRGLGLLTAYGELLELDAELDREAVGATIGGMGLTGVIVWAQIALRRLPSPLLSVDTDRVAGLDEALTLLDGPGGSHRVAWLDLLGPGLARGVVTRAEPVEAGAGGVPAGAHTTVPARLRIPPRWPGGLLRTDVVRAHNALRYRTAPRAGRDRLEAFGPHMFPLDVLDAWPRLYGTAGFVQYQLVLPKGREAELERLLGRLRASSVPCYLAVLKDFGPANAFPLSFPLEGWTLALDLPRRAPGLDALLDDFDELVAGAGGRVYLAKDGRLRADALAAMYPRLQEWRAVRDRLDPEGRWRSDLGVRTGLVSR